MPNCIALRLMVGLSMGYNEKLSLGSVRRAHIYQGSRVVPYPNKMLSDALNLIVCCMTYRILYVEKIWYGKNWQIWQIECHLPVF